MNNRFFLYVVFFAVAVSSCTSLSNEKEFELEITNEPEILSSRVLSKNEPIIFSDMSSKASIGSEMAAFSFTEYQQITTPQPELSATYIAQSGNYLYITYHLQGAQYGGAIDIYNISRGTLESLVEASDIDWNSLIFDEVDRRSSQLIVMGDTPNGAVLHTISVSTTGIISGAAPVNQVQNEQRVLELEGPSGNSVIRMDNSTRLYATSGGTGIDGGVFEIDYRNLTVNNRDNQSNMKYLTRYGSDKFVALKGGANAELRVYNHPNFNGSPVNVYPIGSIEPLDGKNDIFVLGDIAYAAMGNNGIAVVNLTNGNVLQTISLPGTTNAVFADDQYIYASNGELFHIVDVNTYAVRGSIGFEGSANYVHTFTADLGNGNETVIALANGTDGVRLIAASEIVERDIQQTGSRETQWAPAGADRFSVGQLNAGESMLFEVLDASGNILESFGVDLPGGMGIHFQTSVEGDRVRATFNGFPGTEIDDLPETASQPVLNDNPGNGNGRVKRLTSRFDQNGRHIWTVDYEGNDVARVVVDEVGSGISFDLILENGRNFFYAHDGTVRIRNKGNGQQLHVKASNNNTWGGIN